MAAMRGKSAHATLMWRHVYRVVTVKEQHKRFLNIALGHSKAAVRELSMHKDTAQITVNSLKKQLKDASDLEQSFVRMLKTKKLHLPKSPKARGRDCSSTQAVYQRCF